MTVAAVSPPRRGPEFSCDVCAWEGLCKQLVARGCPSCGEPLESGWGREPRRVRGSKRTRGEWFYRRFVDRHSGLVLVGDYVRVGGGWRRIAGYPIDVSVMLRRMYQPMDMTRLSFREGPFMALLGKQK